MPARSAHSPSADAPARPSAAGISVVATVLNESRQIERLLDSLASQTRRPDEIVIVDGGSTDGTLEALRARERRGDLPLRVLSQPGANISEGRNAAIDAARHDTIACTDAGVHLSPGWLAALTQPFSDGAELVGGFFEADPTNVFEMALGATTLPTADDIDAETFLPSSRSVAYSKRVWRTAGGYPEWLDYCEDLVFDFRARHAASATSFAPEAVVYFKPRPSLRDFARQYYLYARGDGKAALWVYRHLIRYATYLVAIPALVALTLLGSAAWALALAAGLLLMIRRPLQRLMRTWHSISTWQRVEAALWIPVIRIVGDTAKMVGYPVGVLWRWRNKPPDWRPRPDVGKL